MNISQEELGSLTKKQQELVSILELISIEEFIYLGRGFSGRSPKDRTTIARAMVITCRRQGRCSIGLIAIVY
jgi:hypothetical protein